ncbi:MAG TPA: GTP-binding protein [Mycobacterium sp.]|nr:GTP-binding protein [Mycobacterium sp.]
MLRWCGGRSPEMPPSVYRIKGFLYDAYDPDRRQLVQAVGMRSDVHPLGSWTDGRRETVLVIIAERDHIDPHDVNSPLDACLVAPPRRSAVPVPSADAGTWRRGTYRCLLTTFSGWV